LETSLPNAGTATSDTSYKICFYICPCIYVANLGWLYIYTYICYVEPDSQYMDIYLGEMLAGAFGRFIFHTVAGAASTHVLQIIN
jgi:hypothetical protein